MTYDQTQELLFGFDIPHALAINCAIHAVLCHATEQF